MFKSLISFLLILSLSSMNAMASTQDGLLEAYQELHYSLSVEWDQKDQQFYQLQTDKFLQAVESLRKEGLSNQELIRFALSTVQDQQLALDLENNLNLILSKNLSSSEANTLILESLSHSGAKGANWIGVNDIPVLDGFIIIIVAVIVTSKIFAKN